MLLLNYLLRNGSERVVTSAREHMYDLKSFVNFSYVDELGKDQGINIRHKVKEIIDFVQDDGRLREERKKAKKNRDKYIGLSSDSVSMRFSANMNIESRNCRRSSDEDEFEESSRRQHRSDFEFRDADYENTDNNVLGKSTRITRLTRCAFYEFLIQNYF